MPSFSQRRAVLFALSLSVLGCGGAELDGPQTPEGSDPGNTRGDGGTANMDAGAADGGTVARCSPTLASLQSSVFSSQCASAGCHVGNKAAAALDLTRSDLERVLTTQSASSCSNQMLVVPGSPDTSLLLTKMNGHLPAGCGEPMPPTGVPLPAAHVECVRGWIASLKASDGGVVTNTDAGGSDAGAVMTCSTGLTSCNGSCVDTLSDPNNCQGCNVKCSTGQLCTPNGCSSTASCGQLTQCGSACVNTATSVTSCGACGKACAAGQTCEAGVCVCPNGGSLCSSACVDLKADANNCGVCGTVCGGGKSCIQGVCTCASGPVSFSQVATILDDNCTNAGCHVGTVPKEGLNLTTAKAYAELVNVKASQCSDGRLLVPTSGTGKSYLLQKLTGQDMCSGSKMPKADTMLPASELALIQAWICNGAKP